MPRLLILILLLLVFTPAQAQAPANNYPGIAIATTDVNFRSGPGANYGILAVIKKGAEIWIDPNATGDWQQAWYNGQEGWVARKYFERATNPAPAQAEKPTPPEKPKLTQNPSPGVVQVRSQPNVGYKGFLIINHRKIGFGVGGVKLNGKYYPDGTIFEVTRTEPKLLCFIEEGKEACYPNQYFTGAYDSVGRVISVKWDFANNRPTGLDFEHQSFRRYYHAWILFLFQYFWPVFIFLTVCSGLSFFVLGREKWPGGFLFLAVFLLFVLAGYLQGSEYADYLNQFDRIAPAKAPQALKITGMGGFAVAGVQAAFNIEHSTLYTMGNVAYVPIFLAFHALFCVFLYYSLPALLAFGHYLFVPHPAEKYISAVKKGKMTPDTALMMIDQAMYDFQKEGVPPTWKSNNWKRRIEALTRRVKAEDEFMKKVIDLIKTKTRLE